TVQHNRAMLPRLARLNQCQQFEHLVAGAEPAGENHQRARQVYKPKLANKEIMKLKREVGRLKRIGRLLKRQADVQTDGRAAGVARPQVRRLHNPGTATRTYVKPIFLV